MKTIRSALVVGLLASPLAGQGVPVAPLPAHGYDARLESAEPNLREFGAVVAVHGDIAAVTNARKAIVFPSPGPPTVHVFRRTGADWVEEAVLQATDTSTGFGDALAVHDGFLLVGEPGWGPSGEGAVHVYAESSGGWAEVQLLPGPAGSSFGAGSSLSASRGRVAVGGDRIRVYALHAGAWALEQELDPVASGKAALHGDQLLALAPSLGAGGVAFYRGDPVVKVDIAGGSPSPPGAGSGLVRSWRQVSAFNVPGVTGGFYGDDFGASLALGTRWAFIGAPSDSPTQNDPEYLAGTVYAFHRFGEAWFVAPAIEPDLGPWNPWDTETYFGQSLALEGDTLWVGAPAHHQHDLGPFYGTIPFSSPSPGMVHRFELSGDTWVKTGGVGDHPRSAFLPRSLLVVGDDEVYVGIGQARSSSALSFHMGFSFDAVLRITGHGAVVETVVDATGDGVHPLLQPSALARNAAGDLYIASYGGARVFRWDGAVLETVVDSTGAGVGAGLLRPTALALDAASNLFVAGAGSANVLKVTPAGAITEVIDAIGTTGFTNPEFLAVTQTGRLYVACPLSDTVFRVDPDGTITLVLDRDTLGPGTFDLPAGLAVDSVGNAYVSGLGSDNVVRISPAGTAFELLDVADGLDAPRSLVVDAAGNLFVAASHPAGGSRVWRRTPAGVLQSVVGPQGDGVVPLIFVPGLAVSPGGSLFIANQSSFSLSKLDFGGLFELPPGGALTEIVHGDLDPSPFLQALRHGTSLAVHAGTLVIGADQVAVDYMSPPYSSSVVSGPGRATTYEVGTGR